MLNNKNRPLETNEARPTIVRGNITRVSIRNVDNMVVCDVVDMMGNFHKSVESIVQGSGSSDSYTKLSYDVGNEVYIMQTSHNAQPYILGTVYKPSKIEVSRNVEFSDNSFDRESVVASDYIISNKGNKINLSQDYGITQSSTQDIRLQLGPSGILRISKQGLCEDYPLKGAAYITAINDYLDEIRDIQDDLREMMSIISGFTATESAAAKAFYDACVSGGPAGLIAAATTAAAAYNTQVVAHQSTTSRNTTLQGLPLRTKQQTGQEQAAALCTTIKLPKTPT
jgi:hypothetical protein